MAYNVKNYTEQGGATTHIGGKLVFDDGASLEGGIAAVQADSEATTVAALVTDFNALLAKLKAAGLMKTE